MKVTFLDTDNQKKHEVKVSYKKEIDHRDIILIDKLNKDVGSQLETALNVMAIFMLPFTIDGREFKTVGEKLEALNLYGLSMDDFTMLAEKSAEIMNNEASEKEKKSSPAVTKNS